MSLCVRFLQTEGTNYNFGDIQPSKRVMSAFCLQIMHTNTHCMLTYCYLGFCKQNSELTILENIYPKYRGPVCLRVGILP